MALYALTSEYVAINGVDYSDHAKSATLTVDAAQLDTTDFASGGWTEVIGGLKSGSLAVSLMDDMAASNVDSNLWSLLGTVVSFEVRPTNAAAGPSNPKWTGSVLITGHRVGGSVGDLAMKDLTFPTSGAVARAIS